MDKRQIFFMKTPQLSLQLCIEGREGSQDTYITLVSQPQNLHKVSFFISNLSIPSWGFLSYCVFPHQT